MNQPANPPAPDRPSRLTMVRGLRRSRSRIIRFVSDWERVPTTVRAEGHEDAMYLSHLLVRVDPPPRKSNHRRVVLRHPDMDLDKLGSRDE